MEKILDVILSSPGTRIGQASECFVYWKDDRRNDTWGLNFTSPIDAKQFRECCDFSKSSARYLYKNGLRLGSKSSPASPTKQEPQCTCLVSDKQQTKLRSMQNRGKFSDYISCFFGSWVFSLGVQFYQHSFSMRLLIHLVFWHFLTKLAQKNELPCEKTHEPKKHDLVCKTLPQRQSLLDYVVGAFTNYYACFCHILTT